MALTLEMEDFLQSLENIDLSKHTEELKQIFGDATSFVYAKAQANLHNSLKQRGKNKYGLKLSQGIKRTIYKSGKGASVYVSQKDNYIVYMHGKGTKQRQTKKGANRGKLESKPFFKNAVDTTIQQANGYIIQKINEIISNNK
ncbi:MAG: hypothetical protein IJ352_08265 [Muribaculaceae bacterium]|nr:hypothetical protein [Muribaculaceae bacterium]